MANIIQSFWRPWEAITGINQERAIDMTYDNLEKMLENFEKKLPELEGEKDVTYELTEAITNSWSCPCRLRVCPLSLSWT